MTDRRDIHAVPFDSTGHRADRRCKCGPTARQDLNQPSRTVYVHREPPRVDPPLRYPGVIE